MVYKYWNISGSNSHLYITKTIIYSMSLTRLNSLKPCTLYNIYSRSLINNYIRRTFQTDKVKQSKSEDLAQDADDNKPIQYSTSPAATWAAEHSQRGGKDEMPWFQPFIVSGSLMIFMIYFFILREPNDIDEIFDMELSDHFKHIDMNAVKKSAGVPITND